jgi:alanyl-tRNA synthetase
MDSKELREAFMEFFASAGHRRVPSGPLVPHDDPSILFTNAGMVQFKRTFTGEEKRDYNRAVTHQKCVRAGGKHNDLENVGYTARHHTFFEMLGNFSFGDYFKELAVDFAWTLLTKDLGLPKDRLYATIYNDDDEAFEHWRKVAGLPPERIVRLGEKDNFWAMGDTGPCGPCSEILIDQGESLGCGRPDCGPGCDCDRYLEIWNLVFMQFERASDGTMTRLPKPSIDTGMGLERLSAVMSGVFSNFETDLFRPLLDKASALSKIPYVLDRALTAKDPAFQTNVSLRVVADHARAVTFLIGDGVLPQNLGRGYVLRRILRRAVRHGRKLGLERPFLLDMVQVVVDQMGPFYPELVENAAFIRKIVEAEEERFLETLGTGLGLLNEAIEDIKKRRADIIPGRLAFKLYDTYGFPLDLVADVAREHALTVDEDAFNEAMEEQRAKGRAAWKTPPLQTGEAAQVDKLSAAGFKQVFAGYDTLELDSVVPALLLRDGQAAERASEGEEVIAAFPRTPFYATSGGQEGDSGELIFPGGHVIVREVVKAPGSGIFLHRGVVDLGHIKAGEPARLKVDAARRLSTAANHSATHLLHKALRAVLGEHARQAGSSVSDERLRFDFTHDQALTEAQIARIERLVSEDILADHPVETTVMSSDEALRSGAVALFEERYGEEARVVTMGASRELCGGTHAASTGRLGVLIITSESAVAAGVRRIEALTGTAALSEIQSARGELKELAQYLRVKPSEIMERTRRLQARVKELERSPGASASGEKPSSLAKTAERIGEITFLGAKVEAQNPKALREIADALRAPLGHKHVIALAAASSDGQALLLVAVGPELTQRLKAGALVSVMASAVGGRGGGKPELAQAGGPNAAGLEKALELVRAEVASA